MGPRSGTTGSAIRCDRQTSENPVNPAPEDAAYWSEEGARLLTRLGSSPHGLSSSEAAERLKRTGRNLIADEKSFNALGLLLRQFESPLVLILVFAALLSLALLEWVNATIILAIVLGSTLLGSAQEYRASAAVAELRRRIALTAKTLRDGAVQAVPASTIVPGDIVQLCAGNLVPADGIVLSAKDFLVSEASLTGESFPVEKQPGVSAPDASLAQRTNVVFLGTSVRSGTAEMLVAKTGRDTEFGAIAVRLKRKSPDTEFQRDLRQFGRLLIRVMFVMVLFVLTVNQLLGRPFLSSLLFALALAVGLSPELLPAIVSVTLSAGARAMARAGVIVRRLEAIENLGSMDVLCTDKTGTLTEGVVVLSEATDTDGLPSAGVLKLAFVNAAFETGIDNPLDTAILARGKDLGLSTGGYSKIDEIPYDFLRKRLTIVAASPETPGRHLIVTKGAFENMLSISATYLKDGVPLPLDEAARARMEIFYRGKGAEGFRVLALATGEAGAKPQYTREDERDLCLAGFLVFLDPPKAEARRTIDDLARLGIAIKIVSGDNRHVTAHLAKSVGLDATAMMTGAQIARMKDEALWVRAEQTVLFAEVDPQQKERIVRALQKTGHTVGYLGDGINDAPALHAADVGISVDQAVDVARESADIILLRPDLDVLRRGVEDGRRTFANTMKYICITISANFGNMVSMALATPLLPFLPLVAKQILLNNFLSDLPSITISSDNVDPGQTRRAQRWRIHDIQRFMVIFGLISSVFDVLTFAALLFVFHANVAMFQTAWFIFSLLTELAVVMVLRTRGPAWQSRPSRLLLGSTVLVAAIAVTFPYVTDVAAPFDFVPLPFPLLAAVLLNVGAYVLATEAAKIRFFRSRG